MSGPTITIDGDCVTISGLTLAEGRRILNDALVRCAGLRSEVSTKRWMGRITAEEAATAYADIDAYEARLWQINEVIQEA